MKENFAVMKRRGNLALFYLPLNWLRAWLAHAILNDIIILRKLIIIICQNVVWIASM